jgi:hypothetical protein
MHLTAAHISPIIALLAGILILIAPRLLNYVVAVYLIIVGLTGLNAIHHFIRREQNRHRVQVWPAIRRMIPMISLVAVPTSLDTILGRRQIARRPPGGCEEQR